MKESLEQQLSIIKQGAVQVLPEEALIKKLQEGRPLRVKLGIDPTAPDLHLGHTIILEKMRDFQKLGHEVIFLIGDFTTRIGDPTGRSKTRPVLSQEEIEKNAATFLKQVGRVLDGNKTIIDYNSRWLGKLTMVDLLGLAGKVTLARLIEREDFQKRLAENSSIGFHELFYPLMQAYDSVALRADVELGGSDQTFNLLMGRHIQEHYGQDPQVILTMPLLEGLDGVQKMSKSLGNYVGLYEDASVAFGKIMSISDALMWRYYELLLRISPAQLLAMQEDVVHNRAHPMELKKQLAHAIVARYWSVSQADEARAAFEAIFQKHDYSAATPFVMPHGAANPLWIVDLMLMLGAVSSSSEAKRIIESGGVHINQEKVISFKDQVTWSSGTIIKIGKHRVYKLE